MHPGKRARGNTRSQQIWSRRMPPTIEQVQDRPPLGNFGHPSSTPQRSTTSMVFFRRATRASSRHAQPALCEPISAQMSVSRRPARARSCRLPSSLCRRISHRVGSHDCPWRSQQDGQPHVQAARPCQRRADRNTPTAQPRIVQHFQQAPCPMHRRASRSAQRTLRTFHGPLRRCCSAAGFRGSEGAASGQCRCDLSQIQPNPARRHSTLADSGRTFAETLRIRSDIGQAVVDAGPSLPEFGRRCPKSGQRWPETCGRSNLGPVTRGLGSTTIWREPAPVKRSSCHSRGSSESCQRGANDEESRDVRVFLCTRIIGEQLP